MNLKSVDYAAYGCVPARNISNDVFLTCCASSLQCLLSLAMQHSNQLLGLFIIPAIIPVMLYFHRNTGFVVSPAAHSFWDASFCCVVSPAMWFMESFIS